METTSTIQVLGEKPITEKAEIIKFIEKLAIQNLNIEDMERIFLSHIKATFFIESLEQLIDFDLYYDDYPHFQECYDPNNFYERALLELIKEQHPEYLE